MREHCVHIGSARHVPLRQIVVEESITLEHRAHIGDMGHVPLPDRSVIFGAITRWGFLKAWRDSLLELRFSLR